VKILTHAELMALARKHGVPEDALDIAAAIAMAESGGGEARGHATLDPKARKDSNGRWSIGLWQINSLNGPPPGEGRSDVTNDELATAAVNARMMVEISSQGTNWKPWGAFKNGSFRRFLTKEEPLMALSAAEQKQLLETTMATNAEVGKLAVAIRDETSGLGAQIAALKSELAAIKAKIGA